MAKTSAPPPTTGSNKYGSTKLKKCSCEHSYQDALHGKGIRVHNVNKKGGIKCTVCAKVSG